MNGWFLPLVPSAAIGLGLTVGRYMCDGHWHKRYFHTCGYHSAFPHEISTCCKGCGHSPAQISEIKIMKATLLWGWEVKP